MGRAPCCDKNGLKKGPWTPEEDQKLIDYIQAHGYGNWRTLPKNAGLQRCGKSCRLRWTNYLRPDIKRGRFSFEEEETIIQLHSILGNKWSAIAARLPGRTDNEIKNYWNTHIRKRLLRMGIDPVTHSPRLDLLDLSSILSSSIYNSSQMNMSRMLGVQPSINAELLKLATSLMSSQRGSSNPNSFYLQNAQDQNQFCNIPQIPSQLCQPNQFQSSFQDCIPVCPTLNTTCSSVPLQNEAQNQIMEANADLSSSQISEWQSSNNGTIPSTFLEDYVPFPGYVYQTVLDPSSEASNHNFGFTSVLSTPSSSPTALNSNSTTTYLNSSSTEDERESYCSNLLKFEIPADIYDVNEFL
ncbi:hypothetical protein UlMin_011728 [Ulmus minor]